MANIELNRPGSEFYEPGYPVDVSPGSSEQNRTAWGKQVLETSRIYRMFISFNSTIAEIEKVINEVVDSMNETMTEFRLRMQQLVEDYTLPLGTIIMFHGEKSKIPKSWALCDGTNGTPDLRDRFVIGAGGDYEQGSFGGARSVKLTANNLPEHRHTLAAAGSTDSDSHGGINAAVQTISDGVTGTVITNGVYNESSGAGKGYGRSERSGSPYATKGLSNRADTHQTGITPEEAMMSTPVDIVPPYCAVYYIMKVK